MSDQSRKLNRLESLVTFSYGNCIEWSGIWSEIISAVSESNERRARVRFEMTRMQISDQNCTSLSSITSLLHSFLFSMEIYNKLLGTKVEKFAGQWLPLPFIFLQFHWLFWFCVSHWLWKRCDLKQKILRFGNNSNWWEPIIARLTNDF